MLSGEHMADSSLLDVDAHGGGVRFNAAFPLALRISSLVSFGALCWASDLHALSVLGIDTGSPNVRLIVEARRRGWLAA